MQLIAFYAHDAKSRQFVLRHGCSQFIFHSLYLWKMTFLLNNVLLSDIRIVVILLPHEGKLNESCLGR